MSRLDETREELDYVARLIRMYADANLADESPEWYTLQSLRRREIALHREVRLFAGEAEFEIRLEGGAERGHSVSAGFLSELLREFQSGIDAAVGVIVHGERGSGPHSRDVLSASLLRVAAAQPGSFVIVLEGPSERPSQQRLDGHPAAPPIEEAFARLVDVLAATDPSADVSTLQVAISDLGSPRALQHLAKVAVALASSDTDSTYTQRSGSLPEPREVKVTAAAAARLAGVLADVDRSTEVVQRIGRLSGVDWWSEGRFGLEVAEGTGVRRITGRVVRELRETVREGAFDAIVQADLERTVVTVPTRDEPEERWRLIGLTVLDQGTRSRK